MLNILHIQKDKIITYFYQKYHILVSFQCYSSNYSYFYLIVKLLIESRMSTHLNFFLYVDNAIRRDLFSSLKCDLLGCY